MIELLVVISIIVSISGVALANLKEGEKTRNVRLSADNIQSSLRQMQGNILSGESYSVICPASSFGVKIANTSNPSYQTFVENNCGSPQIILETLALADRVSFSNLVVSGSGSTFLEVRFFPPFGEIRITSAGHSQEKNLIASFDVVYQGSTKKRTVTVDGLAGRISVQ